MKVWEEATFRRELDRGGRGRRGIPDVAGVWSRSPGEIHNNKTDA